MESKKKSLEIVGEVKKNSDGKLGIFKAFNLWLTTSNIWILIQKFEFWRLHLNFDYRPLLLPLPVSL